MFEYSRCKCIPWHNRMWRGFETLLLFLQCDGDWLTKVSYALRYRNAGMPIWRRAEDNRKTTGKQQEDVCFSTNRKEDIRLKNTEETKPLQQMETRPSQPQQHQQYTREPTHRGLPLFSPRQQLLSPLLKRVPRSWLLRSCWSCQRHPLQQVVPLSIYRWRPHF